MMEAMDILVVCMDGYEDDVLYTKGHVNIPEFFAATRRFADAGDGYHKPPKFAYYTWIRYNRDPSGEFKYFVVDGTPGKQGSFPATVSRNRDSPYPPLFKRWDRMPTKEGL